MNCAYLFSTHRIDDMHSTPNCVNMRVFYVCESVLSFFRAMRVLRVHTFIYIYQYILWSFKIIRQPSVRLSSWNFISTHHQNHNIHPMEKETKIQIKYMRYIYICIVSGIRGLFPFNVHRSDFLLLTTSRAAFLPCIFIYGK